MEDVYTRMQKSLFSGRRHIDHLDADLATLDDHISAIDRKFAALDAQFADISEHYDKMRARLSALEDDTAQTHVFAEELRRRTLDIARRMDELIRHRSANTFSSAHPRTKSPHP